MSGQWGKNISISIFGESHGPAIGVNIDGLPAGIEIDWEKVKRQMARRSPGNSELTTSRNESDDFEILSGFYDGHTTGTPFCAIIKNRDHDSDSYRKFRRFPRPGHADYPALKRYGGYNDHRGGGHFSGRLTAPLVLAGAIARQMLETKGIAVGSHIASVGDIEDDAFGVHIEKETLRRLSLEKFPVLNDTAGRSMHEYILKVKSEGDSTGGVITCAAAGVPAGIGAPMSGSLESSLSALLFAIPAVKGVSFGSGFDVTRMTGYEANDFWQVKDGEVTADTNHNGGIIGGISTGMPIVFSVAFKPTPSITKSQPTVDLEKMTDAKISIEGRHDPCIVPRAAAVVEAACALCLIDAMMETTKWEK